MPNDFIELAEPEYIVEDVLAFRSFQIDPITHTLGGLSYHQEIAPGVNVAQCAYGSDSEDHVSPEEGCSCGWYAYDEFRRWGTRVGGASTVPINPLPMMATGIVRLSGKIIVCERGLKAENMEVVALTVHPSNESLVRQKFPHAQVFLEEGLMLAAYPLTRLERGDEDVEEVEEEMGGRDETFLLGLNVTPALNALDRGVERTQDAWGNLGGTAILGKAFRWVLPRAIMLAFWVAALWLLRDFCHSIFPAGSVGGFGPFVPLGVLVLLSPLLNVWRSKGGLVIYLFLLTYGVANSAEAVDTLVAQSDVTEPQVAYVLLALYGVPLLLLMGHGMKMLGFFRPSSPPPQAASMVTIGASGTGKTMAMAGRAGGGFIPNNRLPKKVKLTQTEGGDSTLDAEEEGGQHG